MCIARHCSVLRPSWCKGDSNSHSRHVTCARAKAKPVHGLSPHVCLRRACSTATRTSTPSLPRASTGFPRTPASRSVLDRPSFSFQANRVAAYVDAIFAYKVSSTASLRCQTESPSSPKWLPPQHSTPHASLPLVPRRSSRTRPTRRAGRTGPPSGATTTPSQPSSPP